MVNEDAYSSNNKLEGAFDELFQNDTHESQPNGTIVTRKSLYYNVSVAEDKAEFSCKVITGVNDKVSAQTATFPVIRVNHSTSKVTITRSEPVAFLGKDYSLKCKANGYPEPAICFDGEDTTTLTFKPLALEDDRVFNCTANNSLSQELSFDSIKLDVMLQQRAGSPLAGIVIIGLLTILLTIIFLICYRKKRTNEKGEKREENAATIYKTETNPVPTNTVGTGTEKLMQYDEQYPLITSDGK